jgi:hypothetical protein
MHRHRRRAVFEWVMLDERNFGKRRESMQALWPAPGLDDTRLS